MITGLCETWLNPIGESLYLLNGYNFVFNSCSSQPGGGVAITLSSNLTFNDHLDLSAMFDETTEVVTIELVDAVLSSKPKTIICEIYRPPGSSIPDFIDNLSTFLGSMHGCTVYVLGDLNIDFLKFPVNRSSLELINILLMYSFYPLTNKPTRATNSPMSATDFVITNDLSTIGKSEIYILISSISDHFSIIHLYEKSFQLIAGCAP